jgi:L-serine/L-threonine ammonia-lyase
MVNFSKSIHVKTALFENPIMNRRLERRILMKMECYQPTGSFKARGIGHRCAVAVAAGQSHLISSSGGNAGYTAAYAGRVLGARVTVVVPGNTSAKAQERMAAENAELIVHGRYWDEADALARQLVSETGAAYIHPFDDPDVWQGHKSLILEAAEQHPQKPDAVVVAVGGGGLLCGVVEGVQEVGWTDTTVLAVETEGADSFATAVSAGHPVTLPAITSIASTLGARRVTDQALEWAARHPIIPVVVSDADAVRACLHYLNDMRVLVEPACGAALSLLYNHSERLAGFETVLMVVCGGAGITLDDLHEQAARLDIK